ncbi:MAG: hypothetical protein ABI611_17780 [Solirubrobacteraceae bacterium]
MTLTVNDPLSSPAGTSKGNFSYVGLSSLVPPSAFAFAVESARWPSGWSVAS